MPATPSYCLYFKFLSVPLGGNILKISFISRFYCLTHRRCLIHLFKWAYWVDVGMNGPVLVSGEHRCCPEDVLFFLRLTRSKANPLE